MPTVIPEMRFTETFTQSNFLRVHTYTDTQRSVTLATIEHMSDSAGASGLQPWSCDTLIEDEPMSMDDAMFIARDYAEKHDVPVIYTLHEEARNEPEKDLDLIPTGVSSSGAWRMLSASVLKKTS